MNCTFLYSWLPDSGFCPEPWSAMVMVPLKAPLLYSSGKGCKGYIIDFSCQLLLLTCFAPLLLCIII